ncbi:MAG: tyrosine-type recombinase/integrase [Lachnospiraceae bacterium]|nr:tyrosine-type recombinase/integrase [Lachnospiraceae bacterium]
MIGYLETQDDVFSCMFEYQLLTGDRYETISALRYEDVDEERCMVHIHGHNTLAPVGSEQSYTVKEGTKGNSQNGRRYMPVTDFTMAVLKRAMDIDPESGFVFSFRGKPIQYNTYASHVHIFCEKAGVTYHNPHSARAFIASKLSTGDNIAQMSDYFGWSDKKMALRYNRNIDRETAEIREKLELINPVHPSAPKIPLHKTTNEKAANA